MINLFVQWKVYLFIVGNEGRSLIVFVNTIQRGFTDTTLDQMTQHRHNTKKCLECREGLIQAVSYTDLPDILLFEHINQNDLDVQSFLQLVVGGQKVYMLLRGLILY
jgi:hypothetical protein